MFLVWRHIPAKDASIPRAHGGPFMPRAHSCPWSIHPEGQRGPIHAQNTSIRRAHPCPWPIRPEGRWAPIHAQETSMPRAHPARPSREAMGAIYAQAHSSRGVMRANPSPGPIHPEDPSGAIHLGGNGFFLRVIFILGEIDFRNFWGNVFRGNFRFGIFGGNCFGENI